MSDTSQVAPYHEKDNVKVHEFGKRKSLWSYPRSFWISWTISLFGSASTAGWNNGTMNLPEPFIVCWIEGVQTGNETLINGTNPLCDDALDFTSQLSNQALNFYSLTVSSSLIGCLIGSVIAAPMSDWLGRRNTMMWNNICVIPFCLLLGACRIIGSIAILPICKVMLGINIGVVSTVVPIYLYEIAPPGYKGMLGSSFQVGILLGGMAATVASLPNLLGSYELFPWLFAIGVVPAIAQLACIYFCEESPGWLLNEGKNEEALKAIRAIQGPDATIGDIEPIGSKETNFIETSIYVLKDQGLRRSVYVGCLLMIISNFTGANAVFMYSTQTFINAGIPSQYAGYCTVAINLVTWFTLFVAAGIIETTGRRFLMLLGLGGMLVTNACIAVLYGFPESEICAYLLVAATFVFIFFLQIGPGPIIWEVTSEFVPVDYRSVSQSMVCFVNWIFAFVGVLLFPIAQRAMGQWIFVLLCGTLLVGIWAAYMFQPETKDRTPQEIQKIFQGSIWKVRNAKTDKEIREEMKHGKINDVSEDSM